MNSLESLLCLPSHIICLSVCLFIVSSFVKWYLNGPISVLYNDIMSSQQHFPFYSIKGIEIDRYLAWAALTSRMLQTLHPPIHHSGNSIKHRWSQKYPASFIVPIFPRSHVIVESLSKITPHLWHKVTRYQALTARFSLCVRMGPCNPDKLCSVNW